MDINDFLAYLNQGKTVASGSEMHQMMHKVSQEALKVTADLNGPYHTPKKFEHCSRN